MGRWIFNGRCTSKAKLIGKTAVITGCNTGIGKVTAKDFVRRGCRVIMACRDIVKAEAAAEDIRKETSGVEDVGVVVVTPLDLNSFASVRACAEKLLKTEAQINLLINNAGVMMCPKGLTEDGFETQFGVNHLGHFLFTLLLMPKILKSTPARIVTVSSMAHLRGSIHFDDINWEKSYNSISAYGQSKLANVLFSSELARRLEGKDVTTYSLHPGVINTELGRHLDTALVPGSRWVFDNIFKIFIKSPEQGAQTTIYCAVDESVAKETGLYYSDCSKTRPSAKARDPELAKRLWEESVKMVGLQNYNPFA